MKIRRVISIIILLTAVLAVGPGCSKQAKAQRLLERADREFKTGQFLKAEVYYLNALQLTGGKNPAAIRQLGLIYYEQGKLTHAYAYLQKAAEDEPDNVDVRLKFGLANLAMRQLKQAGEEATVVLAKDPGNEEALLLLAESADEPKAVEVTLQRIENLRKQDKDRTGYHLALATLYAKQKDVAKAEAECKQALQLNPKSSAAHVALGNFAWAKNDLATADKELKLGAELAPPRTARHLVYATFKLKTGEIEEAKKLFEEMNKQTPDYAPPLGYLMQVAFAESRFEDCSTLNTRFLALDPLNYEALLMSGKLKLVEKKPDGALTDFQRMIPMYEKVPEVHYHFALAHALKDDLANAMSSLSQALKLNPRYPDAILLTAEINIRRGNAAAAISPLSELIKQQPKLTKAHLLLANAYGGQKNLEQAAQVYRDMMPIFPKSPEAPALLGAVLLQLRKLADARTAFEQALQISPDYFPASEQLVYLDLAQKKPDSALERVNTLIRANPKAAGPYVLLASYHLAEQNQDQAEAALLKAIEYDPLNQPAFLMLSQLYIAGGKARQALEKLSTLAAKGTNSLPVFLQIGLINDQLKDVVGARDAYEKALTINSNSLIALNNLAYLYSGPLNQLDRASELAERARRLFPDDPSSAETLGWIVYKKGDYLRALGLIQQGAAKLGENPEVQFHLGMAHYMLGQELPAQVALQKAVQTTNDFPGKAEAQRRLAVLALDTRSAGAEAAKDLEARQQKEPDDPVVLARLAAVYERGGDTNKAVKTYETVLKNNPKNVTAMLKLVGYYSSPALNDPGKVLELLKQAHQLSPEDAGISYQLGSRFYQIGDYKWALSLFQEAANKLPNEPNVTFDLALAQYASGQVEDAVDSAQTALKASGSFARANEAKQFLSMVTAFKSPTQTRAVAAEAAQILKTDSNYVPALMIAGSLHKAQGHAADAINAYQYILVRYPLFAPAMRELALLFADQPESDQKAFELATKAREAFPGDPEIARALGILAYRKGDYRRSIQLLTECETSFIKDPVFFYFKGMGHYQLKQTKESKAALQRALTLNLPPKLADEAKRVLEGLK